VTIALADCPSIFSIFGNAPIPILPGGSITKALPNNPGTGKSKLPQWEQQSKFPELFVPGARQMFLPLISWRQLCIPI
jgi:hypothetical protein